MRLLPLLPLALLAATEAPADPLPAYAQPGHSMNGEAFDEGPRQFAHLIPGCTAVHFEITTRKPEAQRFFDQGVTQLHGFWYFEAERSFRQAAWLDPDCAMAYWGMSMANLNNEKRAEGFIDEAGKRREKASPREQRWIDLWAAFMHARNGDDRARREALVKGYQDLVADFPEDLEARAFLLFQHWDDTEHGIALADRQVTAGLADPVLAKQPMHPGIHHYLIHLWNVDGQDQHGLPSAALCAQTAPAIAHLWHMPSHTYSSLKRYVDAAWHQEASARVDHAYLREARILPEQNPNYAHNNEWLPKTLAYVGRVHDAVSLAKNLIELPRIGPGKQGCWRSGRERLLQLCVDFELWDEITSLEGTPYLSIDPDPVRETARLRALGLGWYAKGDAARGANELTGMEALLTQARAVRAEASAKAEAEAKAANKTPTQISKAVAEANERFAGKIKEIESALAEVRSAGALAAGDLLKARQELNKTNHLPPQRAARERMAIGDLAQAESLARSAIKSNPGQTLPYALLAEALMCEGKTEAALEAFGQLRELSASLDLDVPAFARLAPLAQQLQLPADWRAPQRIPPDVGPRPPLDHLGPFRWSPYPAPAFSLPDHDHQMVPLTSRRGHPMLLLFYLGSGCAKCMEQLNRFAPAAAAYQKAGIEILAVSTETPDGLREVFDAAHAGHGFPFKILSDSNREAFRAYGAFDDFDSIALHGAFLIDGNGDVRWQNTSSEPFLESEWLLEEAKRLLALPAADSKIAAMGSTAIDRYSPGQMRQITAVRLRRCEL